MTNSPPSGRDLLAPSQRFVESVSPGTIVVLLGAFAAVGLGVLLLTQATWGVGLIALGCFVGIFARILQAGAHHKAAMAPTEQPIYHTALPGQPTRSFTAEELAIKTRKNRRLVVRLVIGIVSLWLGAMAIAYWLRLQGIY